jgi:hypothetical protein
MTSPLADTAGRSRPTRACPSPGQQLTPGEVAVYQAVADRGELTTRTRLMFWVMPQATRRARDLGPEAGHGRRGRGRLPVPAIRQQPGVPRARVLGAQRLRAGSRARRRPRLASRLPRRRRLRGPPRPGLLRASGAAAPGPTAGTLVIEHAFLADARARAVRLGIGITVQHPLL